MSCHADRERSILSLWERALGRPHWQRPEALLADAGVPRSLGERNRALLAIRNSLFSRCWPLRSDCPACGMKCSFAIDSVALAEGLGSGPLAELPSRVDWHGRQVEVRTPLADDLRFITEQDNASAAERELLARCLPADFPVAGLSQDEVEALGELIERIDPAAAITFALDCPACRHQWTSPVDVADALWTELQRAAELSLTDVDALARCYGWSEEQVFALSPVRRAAYLQLVASP